MTTILSDWAGCTALAGENNYSRSPLTGSYPGSSKKKGVITSEFQGICNSRREKVTPKKGVITSEFQGICNVRTAQVRVGHGVITSELNI